MKNPAAQSLGRLGGLEKSKAKAAAARANGKLGGRPKKKKRVVARLAEQINAALCDPAHKDACKPENL